MDAAHIRIVGKTLGSEMVTVLMSAWNTPLRMLRRSISSILAQTLREFEFLILDDGSDSVATRDCLRDFAARDTRIRLSFEARRGLTATLNRGLEMARGELIARQDADDWSDPRRLEAQSDYLAAHPEVGLLGSAAWTHQDDETALWAVRMPASQAEILDAFWTRNPFVHGSVMFRSSAARALSGYRVELRAAQDYDFFRRLAETAGAANLDEPLYHYRYSADSVSASRAAEQARARRAARLLGEMRRRGGPEDVDAALRSASLPPTCGEDGFRASLKQADHVMLAGRYLRAAREYLRLAHLRPASLMAWGKLARLAVFSVAPPVRRFCFR